MISFNDIKEDIYVAVMNENNAYIEDPMNNYKVNDTKMYNKLWNFIVEISIEDGVSWYLRNLETLDDTHRYYNIRL